MMRFTTPIQEFTIDEPAIITAYVYVTYRQGQRLLTIENPTVEATQTGVKLTVELTERQTARFQPGAPVEVQVNWVIDGKRNATEIALLEVAENLLQKEAVII